MGNGIRWGRPNTTRKIHTRLTGSPGESVPMDGLDEEAVGKRKPPREEEGGEREEELSLPVKLLLWRSTESHTSFR